MTYLRTAVIIDWLEGRLSDAQASDVARTVTAATTGADPELAERVAWLRHFLQQARQARVEDPPAAARDAALALFDRRARPDPVVAELTFDSREERAGVRAIGPGMTWSMIYSADGVDVAIDVEATAESAILDGQVLTQAAADQIAIRLRPDVADVEMTVHTDSFGQFSIGPVPIGPVQLEFDLGGRRVRVDLELQTP